MGSILRDFQDGKEQIVNQKLCDVRETFENYNLISGLHSFYSKKNKIYKNVLPPLNTLNTKDELELFDRLDKLNFSIKFLTAG